MSASPLQQVFKQLRAVLQVHEPSNVVLKDAPDDYQLNSNVMDKKGRAVYFGGVSIKKNYVSYHLMPVYVFPELLTDLPESLRKRMQGKSCFNFKSLSDDELQGITSLTKACAERFAETPNLSF